MREARAIPRSTFDIVTDLAGWFYLDLFWLVLGVALMLIGMAVLCWEIKVDSVPLVLGGIASGTGGALCIWIWLHEDRRS